MRLCADTRQLREVLEGVSLAEPEIALWVRDYLQENTYHLLQRSNAV